MKIYEIDNFQSEKVIIQAEEFQIIAPERGSPTLVFKSGGALVAAFNHWGSVVEKKKES